MCSRASLLHQQIAFAHLPPVSGSMQQEATITLWRPVGRRAHAGSRKRHARIPPPLPDQPIFYPVLSEDYAVKIARDWNVPAGGAGYATRFQVKQSFLA